MKFTYRLTEQTVKAINGHAPEVAEEMGCSAKHVYAILAGTYTDPFAVFERLFAASVRAGCDVDPWLTRLDAIQAKYRGGIGKCVETETAKFVKESSDVPIAKIDGRPYHVQLAEVTQAITQGEILKDALISAINEEKETENSARARFGSKPVSTETRDAVKRRMRVA